MGLRRFPKGDRKALWSPLQRRNLIPGLWGENGPPATGTSPTFLDRPGVFDPFLGVANPLLSEQGSRRKYGCAATRGKYLLPSNRNTLSDYALLGGVYCLPAHVELRGRGQSARQQPKNPARTGTPLRGAGGVHAIACSLPRGNGGSPEGAAPLRYHVGRPLWPSLLLSQG